MVSVNLIRPPLVVKKAAETILTRPVAAAGDDGFIGRGKGSWKPWLGRARR
jgi:hypothetical protein